MARVTVEDCVERVPNRFELVLLAAHRARALANGQPQTVETDNDKNPVVALREIAEATVAADDLKEGLIHNIQKRTEVDEPEPGAAPVMPTERRQLIGRDDQGADKALDQIAMTEEQLLRAMESSTPIEPSANGNGNGGSGGGSSSGGRSGR